MKRIVSIAVLLTVFILGSAVLPAVVVAQEGTSTPKGTETPQPTETPQETDSDPIPADIRSIIQSDMSTVTQEDLRTVQDWYTSNANSLPDPVQQRVQDWISDAQSSDLKSEENADESGESEDDGYTGSEWDSVYKTLEGDDGEVRIYATQYNHDSNTVQVYVETDSPQSIFIADPTPNPANGEHNTIRDVVNGKKIYTLNLRDSRKPITITTHEDMWTDVNADLNEYNFLPSAQYRILILFIGIAVSMGTMYALEQLANRHDQEPEREV